MTDGLSKKNKDAILGYIGRVAYKEYQNLLEERIKEELQSGYDENKEKNAENLKKRGRTMKKQSPGE